MRACYAGRAPITADGEEATPEKSKEQIWEDWVAKQGGGNFQEMLNAQTEDRKYQILAQLLSLELGRPKIVPCSQGR
jgi:hypothetical protein